MKIILEFKTPEESEESKIYLKAPDLHSALFEYSNWLRSQYKYHDEDYSKARDMFWEIMADHGVEV